MYKHITQSIVTLMTLIVGYLLYFVSAAIITFIFGFPIAIGIHTIIRGIELLFNGA
jgi:hypothetical protein